MDVNDKYRQLRNLYQYRNKNKDELMEIARQKAEEQEQRKVKKSREKHFQVGELFANKEEKKKAKRLLDKYLEDFVVETVSDKNLVKDLIFFEIMQDRLQNKANTLYGKYEQVPDNKALKALHDNAEQIRALKETLGITRKKEEQQATDKLKQVKKKFAIWRQNNQASRTLTCPYCGQMVLLKMRTKYYDAIKHPFFKDRILGNETLVENYNKEVKLDRDFLAKVFNCSPDYIDWLAEKWNKKEEQCQTETEQEEKVEEATVTPQLKQTEQVEEEAEEDQVEDAVEENSK